MSKDTLQPSFSEHILLDVNLPGMDGQEVAKRLKSNPALASIADRLRDKCAKLDFHTGKGEPVNITLSLGLANWPECKAEDTATFLRVGDETLYLAKAAGRNQVHSTEIKPSFQVNPEETKRLEEMNKG